MQPDVETTLTIVVPGEPAFPREIPTFPYEGKSLTVHVRTNQPSFTYTLSEDWVTCGQITSDSLRLTVPSYSGMGSRSAELVLTAEQGDLTVSRTFVIIQNSEFNQAFDIEDVDENGVLWFNSINKINKYLGADKLIVPVSAGHGTRETTIASDIFMGADTLGIIDGGDDSRMMGAIRLARASALGMVDDGGALEITVKSCSKLVVYLSSESSMRAGLRHNLGSGYENVALYGGKIGRASCRDRVYVRV